MPPTCSNPDHSTHALWRCGRRLNWPRRGPATPVGFNYYAKEMSWDAVRGTLISTA